MWQALVHKAKDGKSFNGWTASFHLTAVNLELGKSNFSYLFLFLYYLYLSVFRTCQSKVEAFGGGLLPPPLQARLASPAPRRDFPEAPREFNQVWER